VAVARSRNPTGERDRFWLWFGFKMALPSIAKRDLQPDGADRSKEHN
jgi:hypothetical protein